MSEIVITYEGPAGVYRVPDFKGIEYEFIAGTPRTVPDALAERLLDKEDHDFQLGDKAPESEEDAPELEGSEDDKGFSEEPEGVNASDPYSRTKL
jgi:hypothetical protein